MFSHKWPTQLPLSNLRIQFTYQFQRRIYIRRLFFLCPLIFQVNKMIFTITWQRGALS